ncbi:Subtilisin-like protease SBT1.3 [Thalictrum thalictroides]|uniref:Subtilisin-like protease SBT1.3 n=1 Tax=Thalictrum thalictroides TaxID=46969 RepID=A0A7J6WLN9_THATH|nr:Subtilisin-like protease SBT1.3 [Thalictrum thalictroides]
MEHATNKLLFSLFLVSQIVIALSTNVERGSYIIHMDNAAIPAPFSTHHSWYTSTIASLSTEDGNAPVHLYTYKHVMNGFSAVLSKSHLDQLANIPGHIATYPETFGQLHTTHTPTFLGLNKHSGLWPAANYGDDMIIGIIDTGIWPESESFNDHGMPPVPSRWRGACESGVDFNSSNCNRKLIGARSFSKAIKQLNLTISLPDDYDSPRDYFGHGTHTSSTAAGSRVKNVDYFGYAKGTATGVAPLARLAMYKVIFLNETFGAAASDTLAGMDQAIEDGVDLMSLSLGFPETNFTDNPILLGSFAAMEKGIFVSCSAGNSGSESYTMKNGAPWITTIGAGTVDRSFLASVTLGDDVATFTGKSLYPEDLLVSRVSLYYGRDNTSKNCEKNSLNSSDVSKKIVFCSFNNRTIDYKQMREVSRAGALGGLFATDTAQLLFPQDFNMPFVAISPKEGETVEEYLTKTSEATVDIKFKITELGTKPAPQVADFSSRGPNQHFPWVLKPDILAPGVDILAAWLPNSGGVAIGDDYLSTDYNLLSGTSMASPHAVGIAALLKSAHPDWSSAAIKSAMMTTADVIDNANERIIDSANGMSGTPLDFGSGHINPNKALDPGLVYDINVEDYVNFLCATNYTSQQIQIITGRSNYSCERANLDLNYPSFIVILNNANTTKYVFKRVLTNVADYQSVYRAAVGYPSGMKVVVKPTTLTFGSKYSKAEFTMEVEIDLSGHGTDTDYIGNYGYLNWYELNGKHVVRSPIVSAFAL